MQTIQDLLKALDYKSLLRYSYELADVIASPDTDPAKRGRAKRHYQEVVEEHTARLRTF